MCTCTYSSAGYSMALLLSMKYIYIFRFIPCPLLYRQHSATLFDVMLFNSPITSTARATAAGPLLAQPSSQSLSLDMRGFVARPIGTEQGNKTQKFLVVLLLLQFIQKGITAFSRFQQWQVVVDVQFLFFNISRNQMPRLGRSYETCLVLRIKETNLCDLVVVCQQCSGRPQLSVCRGETNNKIGMLKSKQLFQGL